MDSVICKFTRGERRRSPWHTVAFPSCIDSRLETDAPPVCLDMEAPALPPHEPDICWCPDSKAPAHRVWLSAFCYSAKNEQLPARQRFSPAAAASGRLQGVGGLENSPSTDSHLQSLPSPHKHHHRASHLRPQDSTFFARLTAVCT